MADEQDKELGRMSVRDMPRDLWLRVRVLAVKREVATHKIIIEALERYLKTEEK